LSIWLVILVVWLVAVVSFNEGRSQQQQWGIQPSDPYEDEIAAAEAERLADEREAIRLKYQSSWMYRNVWSWFTNFWAVLRGK
jgi:hypothetical protein